MESGYTDDLVPVAFADYGVDDVAEIVTFFNIFEGFTLSRLLNPGVTCPGCSCRVLELGC